MRRRTFAASLGAAAVATTAVPAMAHAKTSGHCEDAYTWRTAVINGGGFVPGIVFNETEADVIYARTDIGGMYRWQEPTQTWKPLLDWVGADQWGYTGVVSVATDPVETNRVYAAVGTYTNDWDPNNGAVLYSDDYGDTWGVAELPFKQGGNMPGRGMGERLAVDPADNAVVYLGAPNGNGLWRSTDHGKTWAGVEAFPNPGNFVQDPNNPYSDDNQGVIWVEFDQSGRIFVGVADPADPLYVSEDHGQTWAPVPGAAAIGSADGNKTIPKQAAIDHVNGHLFIVTSWDPGPYNGGPGGSGNGGAIWRLDLADGTWTDITPAYNPAGRIPGFGGITVDRQRPGTLMAATQNNWGPDEVLFRSTDSGATWETSWDLVSGADGSQQRTDRFTMDHSGSEWLTFGNSDEGTQYAVKHGWMIDALSIDPFNSDRIMWGTGATIWGTEQLTTWDAQGPLVGEDEAGNPVALPVERFTVAVRAEGVEETAIQDIAALGGTVVSAVGDLGGFVQDDLGKAGAQIRNPDWSSGRSVDFAALNTSIVVGTGDVHGDVDGHVAVLDRPGRDLVDDRPGRRRREGRERRHRRGERGRLGDRVEPGQRDDGAGVQHRPRPDVEAGGGPARGGEGACRPGACEPLVRVLRRGVLHERGRRAEVRRHRCDGTAAGGRRGLPGGAGQARAPVAGRREHSRRGRPGVRDVALDRRRRDVEAGARLRHRRRGGLRQEPRPRVSGDLRVGEGRRAGRDLAFDR